MIKVTIIYDNTRWDKKLTADWGFACLIEAWGKVILFDTGARGRILLENMEKLAIDPKSVDAVFISHYHWDHTGGLNDFFRINPARVYIPASIHLTDTSHDFVKIKDLYQIDEHLYSTGDLDNMEHALVMVKNGRAVVVTGCSHPGVGNILKEAEKLGKPMALLGGLHDFDELHLLKDLDLVCPTHCTTQIDEIEALYPEKFIRGGAGRVIKITPGAA